MQNFSSETIRENRTLTFPVSESSKSRLLGKIHNWWNLLAAAMLLLVIGTPTVIYYYIINRKERLYPFALFGARKWLAMCGTKVVVKGTENLVDGENYVFCSNHRSYLDTATLFAFTTRRIGLVAKKELLKFPVLGQGMGFVNIIAIDRSNAERARRSMEKAREVMDRGYSFGVFVEGTRAMPGDLLPFKKGAFHLALQTGAPIIPVAIRNTDRLMGKRTGVAEGGIIEMVLLAPIDTSGMTASDIPELIQRTRQAIADSLAED